MAARSCELQYPLGPCLPLDLVEISIIGDKRMPILANSARGEVFCPIKMRAHLKQRIGLKNGSPAGQGTFPRAFLRQDEATSCIARSKDHGERTAYRAQLSR